MKSSEIKVRKLKNSIKKTMVEAQIPANDHSEKKPNGFGTYQLKVEPNLDLIAAWVRDGLNDQQIATNLGIAKSTLDRYKGAYPEFKAIFDKNRERLDYVHMINAYQRRAEGYTTIEREEEYKVLDDGSMKLVKVKKRERHVPADPRALENWIQLRMSKDPMWGKMREILHNNDIIEAGEGGLIFIPAKKVLEEKNGEENGMETPTETT